MRSNGAPASAPDAWRLYEGHRARFTDALMQSTDGGGRLCLLGSGPCNDVDLEQLADRYSEIHLVDIDQGALVEAVRRQSPPVRALLRSHAPVDLSGFERRLEKWKRKPPTFDDLDVAASAALESLARLPGPFDVVASSCVLTQMSFRLHDVLGNSHPMLALARLSLVRTHLATLLGLTVRGGAALFVSDLTSSSSFPLEAPVGGRSWFDLMGDIVEQGVCYHAANPNLIEGILDNDPVLREMTGDPELLEPWLWTGAHERTYFVYALRFRR